MSWRNLLSSSERLVLPWLGGHRLLCAERAWIVQGELPSEHGWWAFDCFSNRKAKWVQETGERRPPAPEVLKFQIAQGYLVGDRLIADSIATPTDRKALMSLLARSPAVHLIDDIDLPRFSRVEVGSAYENGPLVYRTIAFPLGPEDEVRSAYLDDLDTISEVKGATPALATAYKIEIYQRREADRRRREAEARRAAEEARQQAEKNRQEMMMSVMSSLGDGASRRRLAREDFAAGARAALALGGAELLDHRRSHGREMVVTFRLEGRRFECTCDPETLQIFDSGICLTAHYNDPDFEGGTKGDRLFTLESLPSVILAAMREGKLVVFRHAE